ncbi:MAG: TatD family hydrolase [Candidatus Omnitrophota bacterium]
MLIDTHCHLNTLSQITREEVISASSSNYCFIDSAIDLSSAKLSVELSRQYSFIYSSLGYHPFSAEDFSPSIVEDYGELIDQNEKVVAVGEIGLDSTATIPADKQETVLAAFLQLAKSKQLPIILHNRWPDTKILDILDKYLSGYQKVILHCFSYDKEFLAKIIERGGYVSFSLNILRHKEDITAALKSCPLDKLLLETDSPYMRVGGKPSTPLDIGRVYSHAASIKGIEEEKLRGIVFSNAERVLFRH